MPRTNTDQFRTHLKEWMETARTEPVKITRKSGEAFVLVNADDFEKMQMELVRLQGLTASLIDVAQGRVTPATEKSTAEVFERARKRATASRKNKKAVG